MSWLTLRKTYRKQVKRILWLERNQSPFANSEQKGHSQTSACCLLLKLVVCFSVCCAVSCRAVSRPVFVCDVMRGRVLVEEAIGDSFPATALSLLPRERASEVGRKDRGKERKGGKKKCTQTDNQSHIKHATVGNNSLQDHTLSCFQLFHNPKTSITPPVHVSNLYILLLSALLMLPRLVSIFLASVVCKLIYVCGWLTADSSVLLFHTDEHDPENGHFTHCTLRQLLFGPVCSWSAWLISPFHTPLLSPLALPSIPCEFYITLSFSLFHLQPYTETYTLLIYIHRSIFIPID